VAWIVVWAGAAGFVPTADLAAVAIVAAILVAVACMAAPLRAWWRPVTGLTALLLGWGLRPGDRAWRISAAGPELVVVTARRGLRIVVAGVARDPSEGIAVRRTRTLLIRAGEP
jgi:hypothetical protein